MEEQVVEEIQEEIMEEVVSEEPQVDPVEDPAPSDQVEDTPEEPEWSPNFKYKVYDEEKEIDEWLRPVVTSPEQEAALRELYEKAGGLPKIKEKYEGLKEQVNNHYKKVEADFNTQTQTVNELLGFVDKKDFGTAFKQLGIANEDVLKYALDIVKYQEMSPEQRQAYDQQQLIQQQNYELEKQNQLYQQQVQEQAVQARQVQLDAELAKPEVSSFLGEYGLQGQAFREEVIRQGQLAWHNEKVDLPVEQAVERARNAVLGLGLKAMPAAPAQQQVQQVRPQAVQQQKPVLPNVQSSGSSPARKQFTSLAELKKHAQSLDS